MNFVYKRTMFGILFEHKLSTVMCRDHFFQKFKKRKVIKFSVPGIEESDTHSNRTMNWLILLKGCRSKWQETNKDNPSSHLTFRRSWILRTRSTSLSLWIVSIASTSRSSGNGQQRKWKLFEVDNLLLPNHNVKSHHWMKCAHLRSRNGKRCWMPSMRTVWVKISLL